MCQKSPNSIWHRDYCPRREANGVSHAPRLTENSSTVGLKQVITTKGLNLPRKSSMVKRPRNGMYFIFPNVSDCWLWELFLRGHWPPTHGGRGSRNVEHGANGCEPAASATARQLSTIPGGGNHLMCVL